MNKFILKLLTNAVGLLLAAELFGTVDYDQRLVVLLVAALLLAIVNSVIKPVLVFLSLPIIFVTFGLYIVIINSLMVLLVSKLYPSLQIDSFWNAIWTALVISFVNIIIARFTEGDLKT